MIDPIEIVLPKLGESIVSATVVQWLKKEGDYVALDEPLLEVSTDKVNSEIPSPSAGVLQKIHVREGEEVEVGARLATLAATAQEEKPLSGEQKEPTRAPTTTCCEHADLLSPSVLRLAQSASLSINTLRTIPGTGEGGRLTKKDVERFIAKQQAENPSVGLSNAGEEKIVMSSMRRAIADNMVKSFFEAPHASVVIEADVTDVMKLIAQEKERFLATHGLKLTVTSFFIQAITRALQQFPLLNASLDGETIILKKSINIGVAVHVEKGLVVPVLTQCQERNLVSVVKAMGDLVSRARAGKLLPQEVREGTITLTNFGMAGALMGVPIIRYPEVAIIGIGSIQKKVVVREDDSFAVRQMVYLTLTFDHRVVDGIYVCEFLALLKQQIESISCL